MTNIPGNPMFDNAGNLLFDNAGNILFTGARKMSFTSFPIPAGASILAGVATLAVTGSSDNVELVGIGGNVNVVTVINDGSTQAFIAFGEDNTITAVDTGDALDSIPIPAGARFCMYTNGTWMAAITAASTTTLRVLIGNGAFFG